MKSWYLQATPGAASLEAREVPVPDPGPQQLLVRLRAASLNRGEFIVGHGLTKPGTRKAAGMEGAGIVERVGAGVTAFNAGDRVMGRCPGAFSEYALMDAREAMALPASLSFEEGAAIPLAFLVVHDMLVLQGRLEAGEWVLVTGVSSGVGVASLQAAKAIGAKVIGTSGSRDKLERLAPLGLDVALATRAADFHDAVMQATGGKGVDLVVNTVGGSVFAECVRCMGFEARLATVGYVDDVLEATLDLQALHAKRLTLFGVSNKLRTPEQRASGVPAFVKDSCRSSPPDASGRSSTAPFPSTSWRPRAPTWKPTGMRARSWWCCPDPPSRRRDALQVAFEDAHVHQCRVGGARPQVLGAEAHVIGRLVGRFDAMGMRVRDGVGGRHADHHAGLAADVARHADVARDRVVSHAHAIAGREALPTGRVAAARGARPCERDEAAGAPLQLLARDDAFLHQQRGEARERALVVARGHVMARLHALDGVAVLVHVEEPAPHREGVERVRAHLPGGVEGLRVVRVAHRPEPLPAAQVVDAVHDRS
jgi:NADPH:quinone reductase-like Zn-dependent oxidoreductase